MKFISTSEFIGDALTYLRHAKDAPVMIGSRYGREEFLVVTKEHYDALFLEALGGSLSAGKCPEDSDERAGR